MIHELEVTVEGSLLLALVIAPKATAQKVLIYRKLASNGEKRLLLTKLFTELYQGTAFITEHNMLLE